MSYSNREFNNEEIDRLEKIYLNSKNKDKYNIDQQLKELQRRREYNKIIEKREKSLLYRIINALLNKINNYK